MLDIRIYLYWVTLTLEAVTVAHEDGILKYGKEGIEMVARPRGDDLVLEFENPLPDAASVSFAVAVSAGTIVRNRAPTILFESQGRPFLTATDGGGAKVHYEKNLSVAIPGGSRGALTFSDALGSRQADGRTKAAVYSDSYRFLYGVATDGGSYWLTALSPIVGYNFDVTTRAYLEFDIDIPSVSAPTIEDAALTTTVNGNGAASSYRVRDWAGSDRMIWGYQSDYNKLGSDTPVFHTASTTGGSYNSDSFTSLQMAAAIKDHVSFPSSWWFAVGIQNADESTDAKSFDISESTLEFYWTEINPPELQAATPTKTGIQVSWAQSADATGYVVQWKTPGSTMWADSVTVGDVSTTNVSVTSAVQLYNFRVKAKYGTITSQPSPQLRTNLRRANHPSDCRTDYDRLGSVDFSDFLLFAARVDDTPDSTGFEYRFDLEGDGGVDADWDLNIFQSDYNLGCGQVPKRALPASIFAGANSQARPVAALRAGGGVPAFNVSADGVSSITGFEAVIEYDQDAFEFSSATPTGSIRSLLDREAAFHIVKATEGRVTLSVAVKEGYVLTDPSPDLATFVFVPTTTTLTEPPDVRLVELSFADKDGFVDKHVLPVAKTAGETILLQNAPNPFNPTTSIPFTLAQPGPVSLVVYNALGQEIRKLISNTSLIAGQHRVVWDGKDRYGRQVASGLYIYRLKAGEFLTAKQMLMVK